MTGSDHQIIYYLGGKSVISVKIGISTSVSLAFFISAAAAAEMSCKSIPLTVNAPSFAIAQRTCNAAARTLPLITSCGVVLTQPYYIEVKETIPGSRNCMGVYHCGTERIEMLSPEGIKRLRSDDSAFRSISTPSYFDSILTHELAHAAYDAVPCPFPDCLLTSEYVAYAMQVYSLPPKDRAAFEAGAPMNSPVSRYDISSVALFMAPDQFARNVWAHFSQREDGCAYVADMMEGNFHLDTERP
ncbi:DUF6639 family protein [Roseovarius sp. S4756]|uniref:DUF6639 family protein n=1 Tax=Roseovarius maritimus TaxID=3342637 RepID=UPI00372A6759